MKHFPKTEQKQSKSVSLSPAMKEVESGVICWRYLRFNLFLSVLFCILSISRLVKSDTGQHLFLIKMDLSKESHFQGRDSLFFIIMLLLDKALASAVKNGQADKRQPLSYYCFTIFQRILKKRMRFFFFVKKPLQIFSGGYIYIKSYELFTYGNRAGI